MIWLLRMIAVALMLSSPFGAVSAQTQTPAPEEESDALAAFAAELKKQKELIQELAKGPDPEQQIPAIEDALHRLATLERRLPAPYRDQISLLRGPLSFALGMLFQKRQDDPTKNVERAIAAYEAALTDDTHEGPQELRGWTELNLGSLYLDLLDRVLNVPNDKRDDDTRERPQELRGWTELNLDRAIQHYQAALTVYTREAFPTHWAEVQCSLGNAFIMRSRFNWAYVDQAIAAYEAALTDDTHEGPQELRGWTELNLGSLYLDLLDRVLNVPNDKRDDDTRERPQELRGWTELNLDRAIQHYQAALTVYTREAFPTHWARVQNLLGHAFMLSHERGYVEQAIVAYEAALSVLSGETFPEWASTQQSLGDAYLRADNVEQAIVAYEAALSVLSGEDRVVVSRALGNLLAKRGDWEKARWAFSDAMATFQDLVGDRPDDAQVRKIIDLAGALFIEAAFVEARSGNGWRAMAVLEDGRARLLKTALRLNPSSISSEARELEREDPSRKPVERGRPSIHEQPIKTLAQNLLSGGGAIVAPIVSNLGTALVVIARAGTDLAATVHPLPSLTGADWASLLTDFAENATSEGVMLPRGLWSGGWLAGFYPETQVTPDEVLAMWRQRVANTSDKLWTLIGRDLVAALAMQGVSDGARVIWLPPGLMAVIPIGMGREKETGRYLLDRYEFATLPSLLMGTTAVSVGPPSVAVLANPTLRFAEVEGDLVASWFPTAERLRGEKATSVDGVMGTLTRRSYWHLSSHGQFSWLEPDESYIKLAGDNKLILRDLLKQLTRLGQVSPRLVVLSACESSRSDILHRQDEYFGLPMALLVGGVQAVVGTQWPVDALATMFLMARFYELHLGPGRQPPSAALRQAQLWLRDASTKSLCEYISQAASDHRLSLFATGIIKDGWLCKVGYRPDAHPFSDPFYWAGLTITGR